MLEATELHVEVEPMELIGVEVGTAELALLEEPDAEFDAIILLPVELVAATLDEEIAEMIEFDEVEPTVVDEAKLNRTELEAEVDADARELGDSELDVKYVAEMLLMVDDDSGVEEVPIVFADELV